MRALAALILITIVVSSPLYGEPMPRGAIALEAVTVTMVARNYSTGKAGICQGAVYAVVGSAAYVDVCPCGYYNYFPRSRPIPVISMLSAGGGVPVPSSGYLQTNLWGRYAVFLPDAQGTSGTLVVDMQGRMVGLVWGVSTPVQGGAGFTALITPAPVIVDLMKYAFDRDGVAYAATQAGKGVPASAHPGERPGGAAKGPWLLRRGSQVAAAILAGISAVVQRARGAQMPR